MTVVRTSFAIPMLFVFLWSTGFIGVKLCAAYAEPATFVLLRVYITAAILLAIALILKSTWPARMSDVVHSSVVGILMHCFYSGGVFAALYHGMDAGLCALILGLQPLLTVVLSSTWLGEAITVQKAVGIVAGSVGVSLLVFQSTAGDEQLAMQVLVATSDGGNLFGIFLSFVALLAISIGTIYQKRYCSKTEVVPGACIQYSAAAIFMLPVAMTLETMHIDWNLNFIAGLGWLILFVSIGAVSLLIILIGRGEAGSVSNLFYLVPPLVAVEAWILFDEQITLASVIAMTLCMFGVIAVNYSATTRSDSSSDSALVEVHTR